METTESQTGGAFQRSTRWVRGLLLLGIPVFLVAGVLTRHRPAELPPTRVIEFADFDVRIDAENHDPRALEMARDARSKVLAKARRLRDRWRIWALAHKALLLRMRAAAPNNLAAMNSVWDALPNMPGVGQWKDSGLTKHDLDEGWPAFSWQPLAKMRLGNTWDPNARAAYKNQTIASSFINQRDFVHSHDIELSIPHVGGIHKVALWASGRITESTAQYPSKPPHLAPGEPNLALWGQEQQIEPAYDFLLSGREQH